MFRKMVMMSERGSIKVASLPSGQESVNERKVEVLQ